MLQDASCCFFYAAPLCFLKHFSSIINFSRHVSSFFKRIIIKNCLFVKLVSTPLCPHSQLPLLLTLWSSHTPPAGGQIHPFPPSGHPPTLMAANLPPHPAVIFHPSCLVVKFPPPHPAVILHPCWRSNSPLSAQQSSSIPAGGQPHPSPPSGHPAGGQLPPSTRLLVFQRDRGKEGRGVMKRGDERQ